MSKSPQETAHLLFWLLGRRRRGRAAAAGAYWKLVGSRYVKTDDAYTAAEVAHVTAQIDGPVAR